MAPKQTNRTGPSHGQGRTAKGKQSAVAEDVASSDPFESSDDQATVGRKNAEAQGRRTSAADVQEDTEEPEKSIPQDLLTRVLHEFFSKDATRISRDGNAAVGKYVDVFAREAIARAAVEKKGGFLEVEDLEKIAPQLLLDL